jgi:hypothetical protein
LLIGLAGFQKNPLYFDFIDELLKAMTEKLTGDQCKKLSNTLRVVQDKKLAEEKVSPNYNSWSLFKNR